MWYDCRLDSFCQCNCRSKTFSHRHIFSTIIFEELLENWTMYESSSESSFSSESSEEPTYLNLNVLPKPYRKNSNCCLHQCINGHCLVLTPVTCERISACGSCYAKIRIKPVHVLCYHCTECDLDSCSDCISTDMKEILMHERSKATVRLANCLNINFQGANYSPHLFGLVSRKQHFRITSTTQRLLHVIHS